MRDEVMKADMRLSVLLVEDDRATRILLTSLIGRRGHTVQGVGDAESALEILRTQGCDLVLTDLQLPGMSGQELAAKVRQGDALPVRAARPLLVALSASHDVRPEHFDDVLAKPCSPQMLADGLARWMHVRAVVLAPRSESEATSESPLALDPEISDILPTYLELTQHDLADLLALELASVEGLRAAERFGHRLKGSGGTYGLQYLSVLGDRIEQSAQRRELERTRELLRSTDAFLVKVRAQLGV